MIITFNYDENRKLAIIESEFLDLIRENFSEFDENAKIKKRVLNFRYIPTRKYCITKSGKYEIGLTSEIIKYIKSVGLPFKLFFTESFKEAFASSYSFYEEGLAEIVKPENYQERFYQEDSIKKALKVGKGIFLLKTAAGKTFIMAKLIATINKNLKTNKTLIIVPTIQLVEQTYKDFLYFGFSDTDLCKWSGSNKLNEEAKIIIASSSILLSKSQDVSVLSKINLLLIDECHVCKKENQINNIFKLIDTKNIFGFTGTLPESKIDEWNIIGKIGPILYELSREEMVKNKFISDAEIKIINVHYNDQPEYLESSIMNPTLNYDLENKFTEKSVFRNNLIKSICDKLDKNVLIVIEHLDHGQTLYDIMSENKYKTIFFIRGDVEIEDREKYKQVMEQENNVVCIAVSKIFSTGINIKNLHYILFASAGKAKVKLIQSIGRGVRLHENKNKLYIFDIADELKYGKRHIKRRKEIYEEEGFITKSVKIVQPKN
jgi:superfamily II DNA or RNA helicase